MVFCIFKRKFNKTGGDRHAPGIDIVYCANTKMDAKWTGGVIQLTRMFSHQSIERGTYNYFQSICIINRAFKGMTITRSQLFA